MYTNREVHHATQELVKILLTSSQRLGSCVFVDLLSKNVVTKAWHFELLHCNTQIAMLDAWTVLQLCCSMMMTHLLHNCEMRLCCKVSMFVRTYVCSHVCMYVCMHVSQYVCVYACK